MTIKNTRSSEVQLLPEPTTPYHMLADQKSSVYESGSKNTHIAFSRHRIVSNDALFILKPKRASKKIPYAA